MGNHRFKLSDMIPNAWFYKLKDMSGSRKRDGSDSHAMKHKASSATTSRARGGKLYNSPIFPKASHFPIPSIDSPKSRGRRKTIYHKPSSPTLVSSSVSATSNWTRHNQIQSPDYYDYSDSSSDSHEYVSSESECAPDLFNGLQSNCSCRVSSSTNDIIIDMNTQGNSEADLPPILTNPLKFDEKVRSSSKLDKQQNSQREGKSSPIARKSSASSTGIRLRVNSPKLASRKVQAFARRGVSSSVTKASKNTGFQEGFAVVKSSFDPQRDFRDSMVEMIMENNIRASKDLEDLLACYLSLNSSEYHEIIVKAFEQIWFDMVQLRL